MRTTCLLRCLSWLIYQEELSLALIDTEPIVEKEFILDKKERISAFLKYMYASDVYSDPIPSSRFRRISYLIDISPAYRFFMTGFSDGIQGDFSGLVSLNWKIPISFSYFKKIGNLDHELLLTESDVPNVMNALN